MMLLRTIMLMSISTIMLFASCTGFSSKENAAGPLEGHWRLDSLAAPDSAANPGLLMLAMASLDSSGANATHFYFTKDSVFYDFNDGDTTRASYRFEADRKLVVLEEDGESKPFHYSLLADSTMVLTGTDSVALYFRRR